ncbi:hypothetical protein PNK_1997 [Candidatus Protochlamydia naegleriophila]|uniref:DUF2905 domain-containing protein n=1 Tax=Candidatus Protochlamydia naegleriophila TaxID=389348 RepID=A0A0U5ETQ7_9BACT|nr:DUF2905 domain-containing protein [Candidatus Protochlamydia naegleriophila]CUI17601.1 hypothetical protein PNK_1997 [Candidatus Protochlamydia naegleriophila]
MGKLIVIIGILLVIAGFFITFKGSIPLIGKMPGDIVIKGEGFQFYFPIVTCILLSLFISFLLYLFSRFY